MRETFSNLKPEKPREFAFAASLPILTIAFIALGGHSAWQSAYESAPFRTIFGTGLFFIVAGGPIVVGKYNRKQFWIRRERVRILDKVQSNNE